MGSILSILSIIVVLLVFTFYIDGDIGVVIIAFMIFAPLVSTFFAWYGRKRVKVTFDCDGYVKKNNSLTVNINVEKTGFFPLGIIEIGLAASEVFSPVDKLYKLSVISGDRKSFSVDIQANTGGNGEIAVTSVRSCGFLGYFGCKAACQLPPPKSVGVIPEIPDIKASSKLFRSIADSVMTSDEESSDTAMTFSLNTAPGYEHREYVEGDPLKRVNWKLSAKKGIMMVRLDEAVSSVQPVVALDLFRGGKVNAAESVLVEERIICSAFALISMLVKQGIASTVVYYGADGSVVSESVDNPEYPPQLLLKVLAAKVERDRRIRIDASAACSCVIASTECSADLSSIISAFEDKENVSLIGASVHSKNETDCKMWYLDGDNNFKLV